MTKKPEKPKKVEGEWGAKEGLAALGCMGLGCAGVVAAIAGAIFVVMWALGAGWRAGFGG